MSTTWTYILGKNLLLCIWWGRLSVVYYELLKPNETITGAVYRTHLMTLSRALKEKSANMLRRRSKRIWKHSSGKFYPTRRIHQTLFLRISTYFDKQWTILRIKHKVPFFHNECPIFDKKRQKLICTPDNNMYY